MEKSACDGASDFVGTTDASDGFDTTKIDDDECDDDSGGGGGGDTGKDMSGTDGLETEPAGEEGESGLVGEGLSGSLAGKCVPDGKAR